MNFEDNSRLDSLKDLKKDLKFFFRGRARIEEIFNYPELTATPGAKVIVGKMWYQFSSFMPFFLELACQKITSEEKKEHIRKIAFEEMGEGYYKKRHSKIFLDAVSISRRNSRSWKKAIMQQETSVERLLLSLEKLVREAKNQEYVLGVCLGIEIPANENIEALFQAVKYDIDEEKLEDTEFFKIHRENEDEHIEKNLKSFKTILNVKQLNSFMDGFDSAVTFWRDFWQMAAVEIRFTA